MYIDSENKDSSLMNVISIKTGKPIEESSTEYKDSEQFFESISGLELIRRLTAITSHTGMCTIKVPIEDGQGGKHLVYLCSTIIESEKIEP